MTRAMTGSLYGQVPSAAMGDVSDEDGGQSDSQLGGYAVEEPAGASPHGSELESGDDGSYALTTSRRLDPAFPKLYTKFWPNSDGEGRGLPA